MDTPSPPSRRKELLRIFIIEPENKLHDTWAIMEPEDLWAEIVLSGTTHPGLQPIGRSNGVPDLATLEEILEKGTFRRDTRRELADHIDAIILQPTEDTADGIFAECLRIRRADLFPQKVPLIIETNTWNIVGERALYAGPHIQGFARQDYPKMLDILATLFRIKNT